MVFKRLQHLALLREAWCGRLEIEDRHHGQTFEPDDSGEVAWILYDDFVGERQGPRAISDTRIRCRLSRIRS